MATIRVPVGTAYYGTIYHRKGGSSSTRFWFIAYFPLIPLGGERNVADERGVIHSEDRIYLPSLLLALFNAWGLVAAVVLFHRAYFQAGHTMDKTIAALAMMALLFVSWIWGGGLWRVPGMLRRTLIMSGVLGAIGVGAGVLLVTETRASEEAQAQHATDGLTPEQKLKGAAAGLKALADQAKAARAEDLDASCAKGDKLACVEAAFAHESEDPAKALAAYQSGCDAGVGRGCARLGLSFRYRNKPDLAKAWQLMTRACDLGDGFGCYHLGDMSKLGSGTPRDPVAAAGYFKRGCDLGYAAACKAH
ncbi:MAG: hypothetical protein U0359_15765 [Byssovorax sp.]